MVKKERTPGGSLPTNLSNNFALIVVFFFSFICPAYVWIDLPIQNNMTQILISLSLVVLFFIFLRMAIYVYKNIRDEESRKKSGYIAFSYSVAGLINFLLYVREQFKLEEWSFSQDLKVATLLVLGIIAYLNLKKKGEKEDERSKSIMDTTSIPDQAA